MSWIHFRRCSLLLLIAIVGSLVPVKRSAAFDPPLPSASTTALPLPTTSPVPTTFPSTVPTTAPSPSPTTTPPPLTDGENEPPALLADHPDTPPAPALPPQLPSNSVTPEAVNTLQPPTTPDENEALPPHQPILVQPPVVAQQPSLIVAVDVGLRTLIVGATTTISITIFNQAADPADDVQVRLPVPDGAVFVTGPVVTSTATPVSTPVASPEATSLPTPVGSLPVAEREATSLPPAIGATATAVPTTGTIGTTQEWSLPQLSGGSSATFTTTIQIQALPSGGVLVARAEVAAQGLSVPIGESGGAIVVPAQDPVTAAFLPITGATLQSADGQIDVLLPPQAAAEQLTIRHGRTPVSGEQMPPPGLELRRGFGTFFLNATDDQAQQVHQFAKPLTITLHYSPEQLQLLGIAEHRLTLFWFDEQADQWTPVPTTVDPATHTASAVLDHFTGLQFTDVNTPSHGYLPTLQGWQVSLFTGAATYGYPIEVPAGPAGIKPELQLSYNSGATDGPESQVTQPQAGWVGKGWSLDTGSVALNKLGGGTEYFYTLVVNGQAFDLVRGAAIVTTTPRLHIPTDWAWHPTDESFIKVRAILNEQVVNNRGILLNGVVQPRYTWQVWTKDGTRYEFSEDLWWGFVYCPAAPPPPEPDPVFVDVEAYRWLLASVTDTHSNTIKYNYGRANVTLTDRCTRSNHPEGTVDWDIWPTSITWGGDRNSGANPRYRVEFASSTRAENIDTQPVTGSEHQMGGTGAWPQQTRQLNEIKVSSRVTDTWRIVRQYNLTYYPRNESVFSDQSRCKDNCDTPDDGIYEHIINSERLTLKSIQRVGWYDPQPPPPAAPKPLQVLPATVFSYQRERGTAVDPNDGWNRLTGVDNGQGGTLAFAYTNIARVRTEDSLNRLFRNNHRVQTKTTGDGQGHSYTWRYDYSEPAYNSFGRQLVITSTHEYPNSAVLYLNRYGDGDAAGEPERDKWLVHGLESEFRGHATVTETLLSDPTGPRIRHSFYQGDAGCKPTSAYSPAAIKGDGCFQSMRNHEFWKGRERKTEVLSQAGKLLQEVEHIFALDFYGYRHPQDPEHDSHLELAGLFRGFSYISATLESMCSETAATCTTPSSKRTTYRYNPAYQLGGGGQQYGNLTNIEEYDQTGTRVRSTENFYNTRNDAQSYIVDRKGGDIVRDGVGVGNLLAINHYLYDDNTNTFGVGPRGRLRLVRKYANVPLVTALSNQVLHGTDTEYTYDLWGNPTETHTFASTGTYTATNGTLSIPGSGSLRTTTSTTYDPTFHVFPTQINQPLGLTEHATYDYRMGTLTSVTDPNGKVTVATYDVFGRLEKLVKPGDSEQYPTIEANYGDSERPFRYTIFQREDAGTGNLRTTSRFYDGLGREIQTRAHSTEPTEDATTVNTVVDKVYDGLDRVVRESRSRYISDAVLTYTPPTGTIRWTDMAYDALGRTTVITNPDSTRIEHRYGVFNTGALLGVVRLHDVLDSNRHRTQQRYDSLGRLVTSVEIEGDCGGFGYSCTAPYTTTWTMGGLTTYTNYTYSGLDLLTNVADAAQNQTTMQYDSLGRKLTMRDPDMGRWQYQYNPAGSMVKQTDAKQQTTHFSYDSLERLTGKFTTAQPTPLLHDTFDSANASTWSFSGHQSVPVAEGSNNVLQLPGTGTGHHANFYRTAFSLSHGHGMRVRFKLDNLASAAHFAVEADDPTYRRFAVLADSTLFVQYNATGGGNWVYPKTILPSLQINTWYVLEIVIDDVNGLKVEVYQENNLTMRGSYQLPMPSSQMLPGKQWRFHTWNGTGLVTMDDYQEFNAEFTDGFDNKNSAPWYWIAGQTVPFNDAGNNVIKSTGSAVDWGNQFHRSAYGLENGKRLSVRFKVDAGNTDAHFAIESHDPPYRRFGAIAELHPTTGQPRLKVQSISEQGVVYPADLIANLAINTWYVLEIGVDDADGFTIRAYQEANPALGGSYRYAMAAGRQWRFHHWIGRGSAYLDDYREYSADPVDRFDGKNAVTWNYRTHQAIANESGNNVLRSTGTGDYRASDFNRTVKTLRHGSGVQLRFKVNQGNTFAHLMLERMEPAYFRFGVIASANKLYVQTAVANAFAYPADGTVLPTLLPNTWYVVQLLVDDVGGFTVTAYQEDKPAVRGTYRTTMPAGKAWYFHHEIFQGMATLDDYQEGSFARYRYDEGLATINGKGQRTSMTNANATTRWEFDARSRPVRETLQMAGRPDRSFSRSYDSADRLRTLTYPQIGTITETVSYSYDAGWRQTHLCTSIGGCYAANATYTALDQPASRSIGNTITASWVYNTMDRLTGLDVVAAPPFFGDPVRIFNRSYSYDAGGNVRTITNLGSLGGMGLTATETFSYDHRDRLTKSVVTNGTTSTFNESYSYSGLGNLQAKGSLTNLYPASGTGSVRPHAVSQVTGRQPIYALGTTTRTYNEHLPLVYDANGNLTGDKGWTYQWDGENQVRSLAGIGVLDQWNRYDADGERVTATTTPSGSTVYVGQGLVEDYLGSGGNRAHFVLHGTVVAQRTNADNAVFLHGDHLGSIAVTTDKNGDVLSRQDYDPWGQVRSSSGTRQTAFDFTGQRRDENNLIYLHARYYDPSLGRFVSPDTVVPGMSGGESGQHTPLTVDFHEPLFVQTVGAVMHRGPVDPQALNRYSYAMNNPVNYSDPTGHYTYSDEEERACNLGKCYETITVPEGDRDQEFYDGEGTRLYADPRTGVLYKIDPKTGDKIKIYRIINLDLHQYKYVYGDNEDFEDYKVLVDSANMSIDDAIKLFIESGLLVAGCTRGGIACAIATGVLIYTVGGFEVNKYRTSYLAARLFIDEIENVGRPYAGPRRAVPPPAAYQCKKTYCVDRY